MDGSIVFTRCRQCALPWVHNPNGISISSAVFAQLSTECPYTLQWVASSPVKIAPTHGGIWTPSNTWFLGPTQVLNPNDISIGWAVFAGLTWTRNFWDNWRSLYRQDALSVIQTTTPPQPFYGPSSGTTQVSRCQKRTSGLYGARED